MKEATSRSPAEKENDPGLDLETAGQFLGADLLIGLDLDLGQDSAAILMKEKGETADIAEPVKIPTEEVRVEINQRIDLIEVKVKIAETAVLVGIAETAVLVEIAEVEKDKMKIMEIN